MHCKRVIGTETDYFPILGRLICFILCLFNISFFGQNLCNPLNNILPQDHERIDEPYVYITNGITIVNLEVSKDDEINNLNTKTTVSDDNPIPKKHKIYAFGNVEIHNSREFKNAEIIKIKGFQKDIKGKNLPKNIAALSSVKKIEPNNSFLNSKNSGLIIEIRHSQSTVVPIQQQQIKLALTIGYHFHPNKSFFLILLIIIVLLVTFDLCIKAFKARPPPVC